jgi:hypothetical protein
LLDRLHEQRRHKHEAREQRGARGARQKRGGAGADDPARDKQSLALRVFPRDDFQAPAASPARRRAPPPSPPS